MRHASVCPREHACPLSMIDRTQGEEEEPRGVTVPQEAAVAVVENHEKAQAAADAYLATL